MPYLPSWSILHPTRHQALLHQREPLRSSMIPDNAKPLRALARHLFIEHDIPQRPCLEPRALSMEGIERSRRTDYGSGHQDGQ